MVCRTSLGPLNLLQIRGHVQAPVLKDVGSMVRKVAVGRSASSLEKSLAAIKTMLEAQ
jgi:hypothetical protein